jgi:hypothetical protein
MIENEFGSLEDDDLPWAGPSIQRDYEAALGGFLVRFNRIENAVNRLLRFSLARLGRLDLERQTVRATLQTRVQNLCLLMLSFPTSAQVPSKEIEALSAIRNELAHGHFEQNPFAGDYEIVGTARSKPWLPRDVERQAEEADRIWDQLRLIEAWFIFADAAVLPVPSVDSGTGS